MSTDLPCQCYKKRLPLKKNIINILIAGVGGQGVLLASEIVAETFARQGYDVKLTAAHGMAQRGGSICSHIRIGKKIYSPLISKGEADILVGMELAETYRCMEYLKKDGLVILLDREIHPSLTTSGAYRYPRSLKGKIRKRASRLLEISFSEITNDLPDIKASNIFLLGILSNYFSVKRARWLETIEREVPPQMRDLNLSVFKMGYEKFRNANHRKLYL